MPEFTIHTADTAPAKSAALLEQAEQAYGFVPNMLAMFAESPALLKAYMELGKLFAGTSFSPAEQQVILLTISRYNECHYCMAAHTVVAEMQKVLDETINAIRDDVPIADAKLEALRRFTTKVVETRGWISEEDARAFLDAGYSPQHMLEVILGVAMKTISNYTNHILNTPVDDAFAAKTWKPIAKKIA